MLKAQIDQKHLNQHNTLEAEFFRIVNEGLPNQHRLLKAGKSQQDFDAQHGQIWRNHEAELIAEGYMKEPVPPKPPRDLVAEIDELKAKIEKSERDN